MVTGVDLHERTPVLASTPKVLLPHNTITDETTRWLTAVSGNPPSWPPISPNEHPLFLPHQPGARPLTAVRRGGRLPPGQPFGVEFGCLGLALAARRADEGPSLKIEIPFPPSLSSSYYFPVGTCTH